MARYLAAVLFLATLGSGASALAQSAPPCAACIAVTIESSAANALPAALNGLDILVLAADGRVPRGTIDAIVERGGHAGLVLTTGAGTLTSDDLASVSTVLLDVRGSGLGYDALLFQLRTALTALRARAPTGTRLGVAPPPAHVPAFEAAPAAYWDFLVTDDSHHQRASAWTRLGAAIDATDAIAATRGGTSERWLIDGPPDPATAGALLTHLASAASLLTAGLVDLPGASLTCDGRPGQMFLDPQHLQRVGVAIACPADATVSIDPSERFERVQVDAGLTLVRLSEPADGRFALDVGVAGRRRLTVDEIVARHQAAAARQNGRIRTLISHGALTVTFVAPGFAAPVSLESRTTIYKAGTLEDLEQQDVRVNGVTVGQHGLPRLPIIEPERVSAPPLAITLDARYRYRLAGDAIVDGIPCYVIAFEPVSTRVPLFRGRVWIAADDFGLVRRDATQTGLKGPVVSSEQTDVFARNADGLWLLTRSETRQMYEGAAYRTPIDRRIEIAGHEVDAADFDERRASAYASNHVIIRDTPAGFRYLDAATRTATPAGLHPFDGATASASVDTHTVRPATRVRTLAFGAIVDPNMSLPLPFAGLSYVDFDLFGTGTQFNGFFGGSYGQLAVSVPSLAGTRWQLAGRAFGIATSYNDRVFVDGREQYDRNLVQRPAYASVSLLRPLTPRLTLRLGYALEYTHLARSSVTSSSFVAPPSQIASSLDLALQAQRHGWDATIWWSPARRAGWRSWGQAGSDDYDASQADYQRYGATLARSLILSPRLVARVEAAAMAGTDLDRFSRFSFGTFDNRLTGYPSALIRYDRGAVLRTALAWSAARLVRLDGFADVAGVHDPGFSSGISRFTGFGAAVEVPVPMGMLVAAEWGYGVQGVNADGRKGTHVVRVTGYKVF